MNGGSRNSGMRRRSLYAAADLAVVISFVLIGRDTHDEALGIGGVTRTAAPFVLALAGAWLTPIVHRLPWRVGAGVASGVITAGAGIYFRAVVFEEGISGAFPVITTVYLVGLMTAARWLPAMVARRRTARGAAAG